MQIKILFGGRDTEFMYKVVGGRRVEKPWVRSMRRYLSTLCIHDDPEQPEHRPGRMVHYCFVTEDSEEHLVWGKAVGQPCCQNREESIAVVWAVVSPQSWHRASLSSKYREYLVPLHSSHRGPR